MIPFVRCIILVVYIWFWCSFETFNFCLNENYMCWFIKFQLFTPNNDKHETEQKSHGYLMKSFNSYFLIVTLVNPKSDEVLLIELMSYELTPSKYWMVFYFYICVIHKIWCSCLVILSICSISIILVIIICFRLFNWHANRQDWYQ